MAFQFLPLGNALKIKCNGKQCYRSYIILNKDMFRDTQVTSASGMPIITMLDEFLCFKADSVLTQMPTDIGQALGSKGVRQ